MKVICYFIATEIISELVQYLEDGTIYFLVSVKPVFVYPMIVKLMNVTTRNPKICHKVNKLGLRKERRISIEITDNYRELMRRKCSRWST